MKRFLSQVYLAWLVYAGVVLGFRLLFRGIDGVVGFSSLFFVLGGLVGLLMFWVDRFVYVYLTRPHEQLSMQVKMLIDRGSYGEAVRLLRQRKNEQIRLSMNNVLFVAVWLVLALFMSTSSANEFAQGMVLGIGLKLVLDVYGDFERPEVLLPRLFWPIARSVSWEEAKWVVGALWIGFMVFSVMSV